jgi:hypothetical protein
MTDNGLPRIHPRHQTVAKARGEIGLAISRIATTYGLTYGELFSILGGEVQGHAKYAIRAERHPDDPDRGGDEA